MAPIRMPAVAIQWPVGWVRLLSEAIVLAATNYPWRYRRAASCRRRYWQQETRASGACLRFRHPRRRLPDCQPGKRRCRCPSGYSTWQADYRRRHRRRRLRVMRIERQLQYSGKLWT